MKNHHFLKFCQRWCIVIAWSISLTLNAAEITYIPQVAGIHPDQRPANAPVIIEFKKNQAWYSHAITGLQSTFIGLSFLDFQGAWYTPFNQPGMSSPYDIRGWHKD